MPVVGILPGSDHDITQDDINAGAGLPRLRRLFDQQRRKGGPAAMLSGSVTDPCRSRLRHS